MRAFFMFLVAMVIFSTASISEASVPSYDEQKNRFELVEIDQVQLHWNEFLEKRILTKKELEGVTTAEELYHKIVTTLDEVKPEVELFEVEHHVAVVFEAIPQKIWDEAVPFFQDNEKIAVVPVMYAPSTGQLFLVTEIYEDGTIIFETDLPPDTELIEAFAFILNN